MGVLTANETAWNRLTRRRFVTAAIVLGAMSSAATDAQCQDAKSARSQGWKAEAQALGAWFPGRGTRGGAGFGAGARYRWVSMGAEIWRYRLSLDDELSGDRVYFDHTVVFPVRVGFRLPIPDTQLMFQGDVGLGFDGTSPTLKTGYCSEKYWGPWVGMARVVGGVDLGHATLGPHVGYVWDASGAGGGGCGTGPNPDPERKLYPNRLPYGFELGMSLILSYP